MLCSGLDSYSAPGPCQTCHPSRQLHYVAANPFTLPKDMAALNRSVSSSSGAHFACWGRHEFWQKFTRSSIIADFLRGECAVTSDFLENILTNDLQCMCKD
jgi:hypothetical protein